MLVGQRPTSAAFRSGRVSGDFFVRPGETRVLLGESVSRSDHEAQANLDVNRPEQEATRLRLRHRS
jgi:hypothetical protein